MTTTFHIRQRLARRGGSRWYRDRSERATSTFCGAPVTEWDAPWKDRHRVAAFDSTPGRMVPCRECKKAVAEAKAKLEALTNG